MKLRKAATRKRSYAMRFTTRCLDQCMEDMTINQFYTVVLVVTGIITVIGAVVQIIAIPQKRLRKSLIEDSKLVTVFRGGARADLIRDMDRRSYKLIAQLRYPFMKAYEGLMLLAILAGFTWLAIAPNNLRELRALGEAPPEMSGGGQLMATVYVVGMLAVIIRLLGQRAANKIEYLYNNLGDDEARSATQVLAFPLLGLPILIFLALFVLLIWNAAVITEEHHLALPFTLLLVLPVVFIAGWFMRHAMSSAKVYEYVFFYVNVMFAGSDLPKLRPASLGQTEEDRMSYQKAWERRFHGTHKRELRKAAKRKRQTAEMED